MKYPYVREYDPYKEETNKEKYNLIRQVFFSCSSLLDAAGTKMWTSIFRDISCLREEELQEKHETIKPGTLDQRNKIEFYIREMCHTFLA